MLLKPDKTPSEGLSVLVVVVWTFTWVRVEMDHSPSYSIKDLACIVSIIPSQKVFDSPLLGLNRIIEWKRVASTNVDHQKVEFSSSSYKSSSNPFFSL